MKVTMLGVALLCSGCWSYGAKIDDTKLAQIERGKSTRADVEALIGKPATVDFTDSGLEKWIYLHSRSQMRAASLIPVIGIVAGGADTKTETLTVLFNTGGVVMSYGKGEWAGGGGSISD